MKKIAVILLALCLVFSSSACGGKPAAAPESAETDPGAPLSLSPLLQTASEGGATRLIPTRRGVIALWERGEGYSAAFVSGADSAMTEDLLEGEGDLSVSGFLETETGKGLPPTCSWRERRICLAPWGRA